MAGPGDLDPTFGSGGTVITGIGTPNESYAQANALILQRDGKLVAAGSTDANGKLALLRYNADGTLDGSFGTEGKVGRARLGDVEVPTIREFLAELPS